MIDRIDSEKWAAEALKRMMSDTKVKKRIDNIKCLGEEIERLKKEINETKKNKIVSLDAIRMARDLK